MSFGISARLSRGQSAVAIVSGPQCLGATIASAFFASRYAPFFSRVVLCCPTPEATHVRAAADLGADIRALPTQPDDLDSTLRGALRSVDILISTTDDQAILDILPGAALAAGVEVYFPDEFGIDHHAFDNLEHMPKELIRRHAHERVARNILEAGSPRTKVVCVYAGLHLEEILTSVFGLSAPDFTLAVAGSLSDQFTVTSTSDIARAVVQLGLLCMSRPSEVPSHIRISGDATSVSNIADTLRTVNCAVHVNVEDLTVFRQERRENSLSAYARLLVGEHLLDYSQDSGNSLVNPEETRWKWATVAGFIRNTETV
ncbi:hypothetical protein FA95DRAFT_1554582, partial [Auriscalpium vulgare]